METFELLESLAVRLTYKAGARFSVSALSAEHALLALRCQHANSQAGEPPLTLTIHHKVNLDRIRATADALQAFAALVSKFELHEAAEFFRVDGATVFMPHRAGAEEGSFSWHDFAQLGGRYLRILNEGLDRDERIAK